MPLVKRVWSTLFSFQKQLLEHFFLVCNLITFDAKHMQHCNGICHFRFDFSHSFFCLSISSGKWCWMRLCRNDLIWFCVIFLFRKKYGCMSWTCCCCRCSTVVRRFHYGNFQSTMNEIQKSDSNLHRLAMSSERLGPRCWEVYKYYA